MTEREKIWCACLQAQGWRGKIDVHILPTPEILWTDCVNADPLRDMWKLRLDIGRRTGEEVTIYVVGTAARESLFSAPDVVTFRGDVWATLGTAGCPAMWGRQADTRPERLWEFSAIDPARAAVAIHQSGEINDLCNEWSDTTVAIMEHVV